MSGYYEVPRSRSAAHSDVQGLCRMCIHTKGAQVLFDDDAPWTHGHSLRTRGFRR